MLRRIVSVCVVSALATLTLVGLVAAQTQSAPDNAAPGRGQGGATMAVRGGGFPGGNFDPAQIQQMMDENNRQNLNATPDEWKVLGPKFNKVQTLVRSINGGGLGMFGIRRGGPGFGGRIGQNITSILGSEPTALDNARDSLYAALDNTSATTEQLQTALKTFREAREKAKKELADAQADLKKVLTIQQEVTLVAMGLLD